jgi:chitinase
VKPRKAHVLALATATLLVPLGLAVFTGAPSAAATNAYTVAPYVDMTNNQESMLNSAISNGGLKSFTAAFVIGSGCTPIWGDTLPVNNDPTVSGEIAQARSAGAAAIVSFGGAGGTELAQSCTTLSQLTSAYQSVINQFGLTHIDFDVEGAAIADTASLNLRFQAIKALEAANSGLTVSVTIPVLPNGPDNNGQTFLQAAKNDGARLDIINVMTMDYYGSWDTNPDMGAYATQAAAATLSYAQTLWSSDTYANIGITPMIGQNDDAAEVFSEANAQTVVNFAKSNGIGRLAFWSVDRDQPCTSTVSGLPSCTQISQQPLDFTKIFDQYAGTSTPPPTTTTTTPTTTSPPPPPGNNLVANPGFETGALSPWTCDPGTAAVVTNPVHTGGYALAATPTSSVDAQCTQTISVSPNHTYTLSAWVQGNYAYLGDTGTGTSDTSNWISTSSWTKLSTTFTTGASTSQVTIYLHGWYAQGTIYADDVNVS